MTCRRRGGGCETPNYTWKAPGSGSKVLLTKSKTCSAAAADDKGDDFDDKEAEEKVSVKKSL